MESALAWIGQIAEWFGRFIPRLIILAPTENAVKYVAGRGTMKVTALTAGLHVFWPITTELVVYPIVRQTDDLRTQAIMTADDRTIAISGLITYEVEDILKLIPVTFEPDKAIKEIALTALHDVCCKFTWDELKGEQRRGTLETKLRNSARKQLEEYGVKVLRVQLTDLALARVIKVIQSVSRDEE